MIPRFLAGMTLALVALAGHATDLPAGFVRLSAIAPQIAQDIRYARSFNFTGGPVPGYEAAECVLTETTARALIRVEARLQDKGFGLVVFDCYRPVRAVQFFADWAAAPEQPMNRPEGAIDAADTPPEGLSPQDVFFPGLNRAELIPKGYIARQSGHSVGHTVDLGLRRAGVPPHQPGFVEATACTAEFAHRYRETGLDMGTGFDCFSPLSGSGADLGEVARANRLILENAMLAEGFRGYEAEWWHFRHTEDPARKRQDFPVK